MGYHHFSMGHKCKANASQIITIRSTDVKAFSYVTCALLFQCIIFKDSSLRLVLGLIGSMPLQFCKF